MLSGLIENLLILEITAVSLSKVSAFTLTIMSYALRTTYASCTHSCSRRLFRTAFSVPDTVLNNMIAEGNLFYLCTEGIEIKIKGF